MKPFPEEERIPDLPGQLTLDGGEVRGEQGLLFREGSPPSPRAQRSLFRLTFGKYTVEEKAAFSRLLRANFRRGPKDEKEG